MGVEKGWEGGLVVVGWEFDGRFFVFWEVVVVLGVVVIFLCVVVVIFLGVVVAL